jgi:hypothetical protein
MSCPFVYVNGTLNLVLKGKSYQITGDHPSFGLIKKALATATEDELIKLIDVQSSMKAYVETESKGRAVVSNGQVYFDGKPVHSNLADRILQFMSDGLPFKHLLLFMENLAQNPSYQSQQELFDFLENKSLPITEDGHILCYKAVRQDWLDKYSGTISNKIGNVIEVTRGAVDDRREHECSVGLHCGALEYVYSYGGGDDRIVIVKVNPRDAVSVPKDASFQKLRTCRYEVVGEFHGELKSPLYTAKAEEVSGPVSDKGYDWGWADRNYDELADDEYDEDGYDCDGYDCDGYDCDGYDEAGYNEHGYDRDGNDMEDRDEDDYDEYDECDDCPDTSCPSHPDYDECNEDEDDDYTGGVKVNNELAYKPSGQAFHNKRDSKGRFAPRK